MAPIKSNNPFASYFDFFSKSGLDAVTPEPPPPSGLTATGGIISDYESSGTYYRAHLFTSSGTFVVSAIGDLPSNVAILAAGGGCGGGQHNGAGGGAGGLQYNASAPVSSSPGSYTITVGAGGAGSNASNPGGSGGSGAPNDITGSGTSYAAGATAASN